MGLKKFWEWLLAPAGKTFSIGDTIILYKKNSDIKITGIVTDLILLSHFDKPVLVINYPTARGQFYAYFEMGGSSIRLYDLHGQKFLIRKDSLADVAHTRMVLTETFYEPQDPRGSSWRPSNGGISTGPR